jgi:hypothetical protein
MNSAGAGRSTHDIRDAMFQHFADRYFPAAEEQPPQELPTAREHARLLAGNYLSGVGSFTNFVDVANFLSQTRISLDREGRPVTASLPNLAGSARHWIEVAPFLWRNADGPEHLAAKLVGGKVVRWAVDDDSPFTNYDRVAWYRDSAWLMPLFVVSMIVIAVTALSWPVAAVVRRHYGVVQLRSGLGLVRYRAERMLACLAVAVLLSWVSLLNLRTVVMADIDLPVRLLQTVGALSFVGLFALAAADLRFSWTAQRSFGPRIAMFSLTVAAAAVLWVALAFHLIGFSNRF